MTVPSVITDLSTTAALNSPLGGEDVFPQLDNYLRAHAGFIAELRDGQTISNFTEIQMSVSDLTTAIATGARKAYCRAPHAMTLTGIRASLLTASSSGVVTVDVNVNGSTILSTKLTIDANEKTSVTAATPLVMSSTAIADDDEITVDIDGAGTGAAGLIVTLRGTLA
jgi:hemin uptake protein HemP